MKTVFQTMPNCMHRKVAFSLNNPVGYFTYCDCLTKQLTVRDVPMESILKEPHSLRLNDPMVCLDCVQYHER
jgi:hypothetical protein